MVEGTLRKKDNMPANLSAPGAMAHPGWMAGVRLLFGARLEPLFYRL